MTPSPRRVLAAGCAVVVVLSALSACAPGGSDPLGPQAVEAAFLAALSDGDGNAALALTTTKRADLDCPDIVGDYGALSGGIGGAEAGDATTDGDTATVEFSYSVATTTGGAVEASGTHTLVRADGGWRIELPDDYRITAALPSGVVAEASVGGTAENAGACAANVLGGELDIVALPGSYDLDVGDPTGVFGSAVSTTTEVVVADGRDSRVEVDYIDDSAREQAATEIRNALIPLVEDCAASDFAASSCPVGLPEPDAAVTLAERPSDRFTDFPRVAGISSDDGRTWRFTAGGESFAFLRGGVPETFPMEYSGAVTAADDGTLQLVLD
jgi:hypothetical protein